MTTQERTQQGNRLKVVLEELDQGMMVGIQARGCDPLISVLPDATLEDALARVPELVAQARERWAQQPQYPAYQRPPEPPRQQTTTAPGRTAQRRAEPEATQQQLGL